MDLAIRALNLDAADFINKPIQRQSLEQGLSRARERLKLAKSRQNEVCVRRQNRALVIEIEGSVSSHSEPYLREAYAKARTAKVQRVVLHFDPNTSVNGAGIAILTQLVLESEKDDIEIVMAGLSENFRKVFDIVGLTRMIQIFDSLEQACA
jgi:anti-anti-sigma factor